MSTIWDTALNFLWRRLFIYLSLLILSVFEFLFRKGKTIGFVVVWIFFPDKRIRFFKMRSPPLPSPPSPRNSFLFLSVEKKKIVNSCWPPNIYNIDIICHQFVLFVCECAFWWGLGRKLGGPMHWGEILHLNLVNYFIFPKTNYNLLHDWTLTRNEDASSKWPTDRNCKEQEECCVIFSLFPSLSLSSFPFLYPEKMCHWRN